MAAASLRVAPAPHGASAVAGNMQHRFVPASPRVTGLTKLCCQPRRRTRDLRAQALKGSSLQGNSLAKLQQQLDAAVAREDYAAAAAIRDDLKQLETVSTLAVEEANAAFYRAFMDSDVEASCFHLQAPYPRQLSFFLAHVSPWDMKQNAAPFSCRGVLGMPFVSMPMCVCRRWARSGGTATMSSVSILWRGALLAGRR